jgi:hypothetical protein
LKVMEYSFLMLLYENWLSGSNVHSCHFAQYIAILNSFAKIPAYFSKALEALQYSNREGVIVYEAFASRRPRRRIEAR